MNYIDRIASEIQRRSTPDTTPPDSNTPLYRLYALLALTKGLSVTPEDIHNAWSVWAIENEPGSENIKPFKELSLSTQRKDEPFTEVIQSVIIDLRLDQAKEE